MVSLIPILLSVFMFWIANAIGSSLVLYSGLMVLCIGALFAYCEISTYLEIRQIQNEKPTSRP